MDSFANVANLGIALFGQDRFAEAKEVLDTLRAKAIQKCGPEHYFTLNIQHILARVLAGAGRWDEAEALARATLAVRRRVTPGHEGTGRTLLILGWVLVEKGALEEAEPLLGEALVLFREKYAMETDLAAQAENWLGTIQSRRGAFSDAEKSLLASCGPLLTAPALSAAERKVVLGHLVELYQAWGKADDEAVWKKRSDQILPVAR